MKLYWVTLYIYVQVGAKSKLRESTPLNVVISLIVSVLILISGTNKHPKELVEHNEV